MMSKLKPIPTVSQARVLIALREYTGSLYLGYQGVVWRLGNLTNKGAEYQFGKARVSTVRKMIANGWLERDDGRTQEYDANYRLTDDGAKVASGLTEADVAPNQPKIADKDMLSAVAEKYKSPEWIVLREVRLGTGYGYRALGGVRANVEQRLDALAINTWPSKNFRRVAFEVKISRSDWTREMIHPEKRAAALAISNEFYFVVPEGMVHAYEVPESCGLIEVSSDRFLRVRLHAPEKTGPDPDWRLVASLLRSERLS